MKNGNHKQENHKHENHKHENQGNSHPAKQGHAGHVGDGVDRQLHNPIADKLIPLEPLDLTRVKSIDDLVRAMSKTAFTGRQLGEAPTFSRRWPATKIVLL